MTAHDWNMVFLNTTAIFFWIVITVNTTMGFMKRRKKKETLDSYIEKMKEEGKKIIERAAEDKAVYRTPTPREPQVSRFQWHYDGKMNEVEIIIDPNIDAHISGTREEFEALVKSGDAGKMEDLLKGLSKKEETEGLKTIQKFIFSKESVEQMRIAGLSPDEVVAKMLKAAGRMD